MGGTPAPAPAASEAEVRASSAPAAPTPAPVVRSLEERCRDAVALEVARLAPAAGFTISCGPSEVGGYNSGIDGWTSWRSRRDGSGRWTYSGTHRIHPDDSDSDATIRTIVRHEIGHGYCLWQGDESEACAYAYE